MVTSSRIFCSLFSDLAASSSVSAAATSEDYGCFALLDLICKSSSHKEEFCINSIGMVKGSHQSPLSKRIRRRKLLHQALPLFEG
ncbi:hypothetical protein ARALYDRAFT_904027 [Arabidopsis lyrata subsp. lyrata]|uniref:Secreted protein n=1 Tax=Arabidopsis lyrata subsp. lyrata TaxID=81972 RepID=D7LD87_ARALL|nr:hypothetical protein ARALYDRAFT_904027 [Arabidopsis lyrata subsp. lyrata]